MKRFRVVLLAAMAAMLVLGIYVPMAGARALERAGDLTQVYGYVIGYGGVGRSYWEMHIPNDGIYMHDGTLNENLKVATADAYGNFGFSVNLKTQPEKKADFYVSPVHYDRVDIVIHNHPTAAINEILKCQVLPTIITGKVTNKFTGKPVKNVKVQILNWDVKTDSKGVYKVLCTLQPNTIYEAWFSKAGFKRNHTHFKSKPTATGQTRTANFKIAPK